MRGTLQTVLACLGFTSLSVFAEGIENPPTNSLTEEAILKDITQSTPWNPHLTLEVDNIVLYPASPGEDPWSFDLPGGQSCTLSHDSLCCQGSCLAIDDSVSLSEPKVHVLGGVNVTLCPQEERALDGNSADELLSTLKKEKLLEDADEAAGKMFEFAVRVIEHLGAEDPLPRIWKRRAPEAVVAAAARAAASIEKVIASASASQSIAAWLDLVEGVDATTGQSESRSPRDQNDLVRAALNRMQWFTAFGKDLDADPETARTLATNVLYHLGADHKFIGSDVTGSPGSIPLGLDSFAAHAGLTRHPAYKNQVGRQGSIIFAQDISAGTYSAFCTALDGSSGEKVSDPGAGFALFPTYSTTLTERQYSQLLKTDLVSSVFLRPTEGEYEEHAEEPKKRRRSRRAAAKPPASEGGGQKAAHNGDDDGHVSRLLRWAGLKRQESEVYVQPNSPRYLTRLSETSGDVDLGYTQNMTQTDFAYDSPAGQGVTIFVVGSGLAFNNSLVSHELRLSDKDPSTFYYNVSAPDAIPPTVRESHLSDKWDHDPRYGWGTAAASLAAGRVLGVARDADIFAIKAYWAYPDPADEYDVYVSTSVPALMAAFGKIAEVVKKGELEGKSVVLMTPPDIYAPPSNTAFQLTHAWRLFLTWARLNQVTVVVPSADRRAVVEGAAFEEDGESNCVWATDDSFDFGASFNYTDFPEVIHARSAEVDATYSWFNGPPVVGAGEYLYAQGSNVLSIWGNGEVAVTSSTVNSAGIIAGLAAYYLAHPDFQDVLGKENRPLRLKQYMAAASWPRLPQGDRHSMLSGLMLEYYETCQDVVELADEYPYAIPDVFLPMAHNLIPGFQNGCDKPAPRAANSTSDPFSDLDCQDAPPTPAGTFDPSLPTEEDLPTTNQTWSHFLCSWRDPLVNFDLAVSGDDMTVGKCGEACCGHMYMMLGEGTECYCADGLKGFSDSEELGGECDVPCAGQKEKKCGGEESLDVWVADQVASKEYCEG